MASLPPTSLIICSRNRPSMLIEAVESILQGGKLPTELIIVDQSNASNPYLATLTTKGPCKLRYLWTQSVGLSRANNRGIAAAQHDLLVFTHDDVLVTLTWLDSLIQAWMLSGPRAIVTGRVLPSTGEDATHFAPSTKTEEFAEIYEGRINRDVLFPMSMAMHRSAIDEVGRFDERLGPGTRFPAAEDNDLGFRLLEAGFRIFYIPEAVVYHRAWRSKSDYYPLRWGYGRGQGAFYAKHLRLRDRYMLLRMWRDIRNHLYRFPLRLCRQYDRTIGDAIYLCGILSAACEWLLNFSSRAGDHE